MRHITEKDSRLLAMLQQNARASISDLARSLGLSRTTVQDRIRKLEKTGVIKGYTVKTSEYSSNPAVGAFVTMEVEPNRTSLIVSELKQVLGIQSVYTVAGKFDLLARLKADSTNEMDVLLDKITEIPGIIRTESAIILSTKFEHGNNDA